MAQRRCDTAGDEACRAVRARRDRSRRPLVKPSHQRLPRARAWRPAAESNRAAPFICRSSEWLPSRTSAAPPALPRGSRRNFLTSTWKSRPEQTGPGAVREVQAQVARKRGYPQVLGQAHESRRAGFVTPALAYQEDISGSPLLFQENLDTRPNSRVGSWGSWIQCRQGMSYGLSHSRSGEVISLASV